MASLQHADILQLVERAADRRRRTVRLELQRGVSGLGASVVNAPLLGLLATVLWMIVSFVSCCESKAWSCLAVFETLGRAFAPTMLGLLIAVPSYWVYRYLGNQLESLDHEMRLGISELAKQLRAFHRS
ncbi:MAG: MotA/TolQ/ExbB proton channel family protein [Acidobacteria bacterium]|nr:MotA/TolQ/ExbB proton channel family protein [Acidobacteriota bacterium]